MIVDGWCCPYVPFQSGLHVFAISVIGFNRVKGSAGKSFWKSAFQRSDTFQETLDALMSSDGSSEPRNDDYLFGWRASSSPHFFLAKWVLIKLIKPPQNTPAQTLGCGLMSVSAKARLSGRRYNGNLCLTGHPDGPQGTPLRFFPSTCWLKISHCTQKKTQISFPDCKWQHEHTRDGHLTYFNVFFICLFGPRLEMSLL